MVNSAIGAAYYLRIAAACYLGSEAAETRRVGGTPMRLGLAVAALSMLLLFALPSMLSDRSQSASAGLNPGPARHVANHEPTEYHADAEGRVP